MAKKGPFTDIPPYTVRENSRARRVTLKVSLHRGLEVVVPAGFDRRRIPEVIAEKAEWIRSVFDDLRKRTLPHEELRCAPESIELKAIGKSFSIHYRPPEGNTFRLVQVSESRVEVSADTEDVASCRALFSQWLKYQGKEHLIPWLRRIAAETRLDYRRAQVREQRSRWGSCSSNGTISLNCRLLFLRPELVRYVMIHELCHTVHMNHSKDFWAFVERFEPDFRILEQQVTAAPKSDVPAWAR